MMWIRLLQNQDNIELILTDDEYMSFNISDIKSNQSEIDDRIREIVQSRAFELNTLVDRISLHKRDSIEFEQELLHLLKVKN